MNEVVTVTYYPPGQKVPVQATTNQFVHVTFDVDVYVLTDRGGRTMILEPVKHGFNLRKGRGREGAWVFLCETEQKLIRLIEDSENPLEGTND